MTRGSLVAESPGTEGSRSTSCFRRLRGRCRNSTPSRYTILRHADGGGRKHVLDVRRSRLVRRHGGDRALSRRRRARDRRRRHHGEHRATAASARPVLPSTIDTKFGEVAIEPFTDNAPSGARQCLRFPRNLRRAALRTCGLVLQRGRRHGRPRQGRLRHRSPLAGRGGQRAEARRTVRARRTQATFCGEQSVSAAATPSATTGSRPRAIRACAGGSKPIAPRERVPPAAARRRCARRIGGFEVVQHYIAILAVERRHVVAVDDQVDRVVPAGAAQARPRRA